MSHIFFQNLATLIDYLLADWSPKGKHIAIGLQTGDILTFSPTNKAAPHKHIPSTVNSVLVSLNWLGPGHTFRTSYAAQGDLSATQHIVILDTKSSTVSYYAPDHPFPLGDRTNQVSYVISLPKWDADTDANEENKSLTVVGDVSSVDLEVLGNLPEVSHPGIDYTFQAIPRSTIGMHSVQNISSHPRHLQWQHLASWTRS